MIKIRVISSAHKVYRSRSQSELRKIWANSLQHREIQVDSPKIILMDKSEQAEHNYQIETWLLGQLLSLPEPAAIEFAQNHN